MVVNLGFDVIRILSQKQKGVGWGLNILIRLGIIVLVPLWVSYTASRVHCAVMNYIASWNKP